MGQCPPCNTYMRAYTVYAFLPSIATAHPAWLLPVGWLQELVQSLLTRAEKDNGSIYLMKVRGLLRGRVCVWGGVDACACRRVREGRQGRVGYVAGGGGRGGMVVVVVGDGVTREMQGMRDAGRGQVPASPTACMQTNVIGKAACS